VKTDSSRPAQLTLDAGSYTLDSTIASFDHSSASEVWITGLLGTTIKPRTSKQPVLVALLQGAPRVHISNMRLLGHFVVQGGRLILTDSVIERLGGHENYPATPGRRLESQSFGRAISIEGGSAILTRTVVRGHNAGAISVHQGELDLYDCTLRDNRAEQGGALHISGTSVVARIEHSRFINNTASRGGALQVFHGQILLSNNTIFENNTATQAHGSSINLLNGFVQYELPAPPGRYLELRDGSTYPLNLGPENDDFPYACPKGTYGGVEVADQRSARCKGECPQGHFCPRATTEPQPCPASFYQPSSGAQECQPCLTGQSSIKGSPECTMCAEGYFRRHASSPATECDPCSSIPGAVCELNATVATVALNTSYWRHSPETMQIWPCKQSGDWTPCSGGDEAGVDGSGYCELGYRGPRCELCDGGDNTTSMYFNKFDARCHDCSSITTRAVIVGIGFVLSIILFELGAGITILEHTGRRRARDKLLRRIRSFQAVWERAGMRYKVKLLVGLFQCLGAVSDVYNVQIPLGLEQYAGLIGFLELGAKIGVDLVIPGQCIGSFHRRILIGSCVPIGGLLCVFACFAFLEAVHKESRRSSGELRARSDDNQWGTNLASFTALRGSGRLHSRRSSFSRSTAMRGGASRVLPLVLISTFVLVPSTSTRIFKAFSCIQFEYDSGAGNSGVRRYLQADLSLSCDSSEYDTVELTARIMTVVWPVGVPLLYIMLLWASRRAILARNPTPLSRAIEFLTEDYTVTSFWWEPLEMCRKLALTGWVLLIKEESEQARVLVALLVSVAFVALTLSIKPCKRTEDGVLMTIVELALILVYICVLLIKSCDLSSLKSSRETQGSSMYRDDIAVSICHTYGLGETSDGVFQFFVLFAFIMILLQLLGGLVKLYLTGNTPKLLRVAQAHAVAPSRVIIRLVARKCAGCTAECPH